MNLTPDNNYTLFPYPYPWVPWQHGTVDCAVTMHITAHQTCLSDDLWAVQLQHIDGVCNAVQECEGTIAALGTRVEEEQEEKAAAAEVSASPQCLLSCIHMTIGFVATQQHACVDLWLQL